jgi:hypothetical protein
MQEDHMSTKDRGPAPEGGERELDGGAYIGNRPEMAEETIPGGVDEEDERVAGHDTRSSGSGKEEERVQGRGDEWPRGHRQSDGGEQS